VKNMADAFPLLKLSKLYGVPDMELQSTQLLQEGITDENVLSVFEQSRKYGNGSLGTKALEYVCR